MIETATAVGAFFLSFAGGVWLLQAAPSVVIPQAALAKENAAKEAIASHAPLLVNMGAARKLAQANAPAAKLPTVALTADIPLPPVRPPEYCATQTAQAEAETGDIPLPPLRPSELTTAPREEIAAVDAPLPPARPEGLGTPARVAALPPPKIEVKPELRPENPPAVEQRTAEQPAPIAPPTPMERRAVATREAPPARQTTYVPAAPQKPEPSFFERLFGRAETPQPEPQSRRGRRALAYAAQPESSGGSSWFGGSSVLNHASPSIGGYDRYTAIYDISARTVYMPDGSRLEAHSGLREHLDDPRSVNLRMRGATPPNVYELTPRERLFHGVAALRLNPVAGHTYGRTGLLAHTYMLGPNGDSNGCVSFRDYRAFLRAYQNGEVRRLAVVARR